MSWSLILELFTQSNLASIHVGNQKEYYVPSKNCITSLRCDVHDRSRNLYTREK